MSGCEWKAHPVVEIGRGMPLDGAQIASTNSAEACGDGMPTFAQWCRGIDVDELDGANACGRSGAERRHHAGDAEPSDLA